jgi:hypothetical protein
MVVSLVFKTISLLFQDKINKKNEWLKKLRYKNKFIWLIYKESHGSINK